MQFSPLPLSCGDNLQIALIQDFSAHEPPKIPLNAGGRDVQLHVTEIHHALLPQHHRSQFLKHDLPFHPLVEDGLHFERFIKREIVEFQFGRAQFVSEDEQDAPYGRTTEIHPAVEQITPEQW